jgi:hypothetical protein
LPVVAFGVVSHPCASVGSSASIWSPNSLAELPASDEHRVAVLVEAVGHLLEAEPHVLEADLLRDRDERHVREQLVGGAHQP